VTTASLAVTLGQAGVDMVFADDMASVKVSRRLFISTTSCLVAQVILSRQDFARAALKELGAVAAALELSAEDDVKRSLAAEVGWLKGLWRFYTAFSVVTMLGTLHSMLVDEKSTVTRWMWEAGGGALRYSRLLLDFYTILAFLTAYYRLLHLMLVLYRLSSALYWELGRRLRRPLVDLRWAVALQARLDATWRSTRAMLGRLLPLYLVVPLLLPLFSSAEVVVFGLQAADLVALATSPLIFVAFVPQCLAGQRLLDASTDLAQDAYFGPWLEESVPVRRIRLLIIEARPQGVPVPGLNGLSRPTCLNAMRKWFQYVQVLLNFDSSL
ncbi:4-hydroxy-4-methyl-2-oxoglutarate aldolase/4-carboxy-4-hydroxy-2-oxoadipate aldolase, partial [Frankliniella fusca]